MLAYLSSLPSGDPSLPSRGWACRAQNAPRSRVARSRPPATTACKCQPVPSQPHTVGAPRDLQLPPGRTGDPLASEVQGLSEPGPVWAVPSVCTQAPFPPLQDSAVSRDPVGFKARGTLVLLHGGHRGPRDTGCGSPAGTWPLVSVTAPHKTFCTLRPPRQGSFGDGIGRHGRPSLPCRARRPHLDGLHQPVAEFQGCRSRRRAKGGGPPLQPPHEAPVLPVLLDGQPQQVPEPLDWGGETGSSEVRRLHCPHHPTLRPPLLIPNGGF